MKRGRDQKDAGRRGKRDRSGSRCLPSSPGNRAGNRHRSRSGCRSTSRRARGRSTTTTATTTTTDDTITTDTTTSATTGTFGNTSTTVATSKPTTTGRPPVDGSSQNGRVARGAVGGLVGGVAITVILVLLWRFFRAKKRSEDRLKERETENPHTYMGLIHTNNPSSMVTSTVPDVIMVSAAQLDPNEAKVEYDVIQEEHNYQLAKKMDFASNQADYTEITDIEKDGTSQPPADYFVLEKDDHISDDYNTLRNAAKPTAAKGTYNRLGDDIASTPTAVTGTYNRLGDDTNGTSTAVKGTYNRLGDDTNGTSTAVEDTYNRLGDDTSETPPSDS